jgi:hypothetical protein
MITFVDNQWLEGRVCHRVDRASLDGEAMSCDSWIGLDTSASKANMELSTKWSNAHVCVALLEDTFLVTSPCTVPWQLKLSPSNTIATPDALALAGT